MNRKSFGIPFPYSFILFLLGPVLAAQAGGFKNLNESKEKAKTGMERMRPYLGRWVGETHSELSGSKMATMICTYDNDWMMDAVYLVATVKCKSQSEADSVESKWVYTFDAIKDCYRLWGYSSTGVVLEYEGKFAAGKFTWKMKKGQYRFRGEMLESVRGDSLMTSGINYKPDGTVMEKSLSVFKKIR